MQEGTWITNIYGGIWDGTGNCIENERFRGKNVDIRVFDFGIFVERNRVVGFSSISCPHAWADGSQEGRLGRDVAWNAIAVLFLAKAV